MLFPFAAVRPSATSKDPVVSVAVDPELGNEGFTYTLRSGAEGTVHIDHVLEYNRDPAYLSRQMVYELTLLAEKAVAASPLSTRELTRRLKTSASQFYRLLDPTNSKKSLAQVLELLGVLDCDIDLSVRYGERSNRQEKRLGFSAMAEPSSQAPDATFKPCTRSQVMTDPRLNIDRLTPEEQLQLIEDLWESLEASGAPLPLSAEQRSELDSRLDEFERDGPRGIPWDEVVGRIRGEKD